MLFSYLVPVYNVKDYIRKCVESILIQQGADFEIVLIDDGSTDGSGAVCDEYARLYPETVRVIHKKNEGLLVTRRRGFREAKGDWFFCVDSDDYIMENHLQTIVEAIREYECDLLLFNAQSFYPDGRTEPFGIGIEDICVFKGEGKKDIYQLRLLKNKYNNMCYKAIHRSIVDFETDYGQFGIRNMCEDAVQSYELYTRAKKIVYVPCILYAYRRNIASISSNIGEDYWHALRVSYELGWEYMNLWGMAKETAQAYGARCVSFYCDFLNWLLKERDIDRAKRKTLFRKVILENEFFDRAAGEYKEKYLATKYLKLRNPLIVSSIRLLRSWIIAKIVFCLERLIRGS